MVKILRYPLLYPICTGLIYTVSSRDRHSKPYLRCQLLEGTLFRFDRRVSHRQGHRNEVYWWRVR